VHVNQGATEPQIDDLLLPFLNARGEAESDAVLEQLILEHAQPLIRDIIGFKLKSSLVRRGASHDTDEVEDASNEVIARLIRTLRESKNSSRTKPISSFRGYVATMAYNASDEFLRHKYPRRYSLKNRVRYVLTHRPELALWEGENRKVLCGLVKWDRASPGSPRAFRDQQNSLISFLHLKFRDTALDQLNPAEVVPAILEFANAPLEIDELVTVLAEILGISDAPAQSELNDASSGVISQLSVDPRGTVDDALDRRARLGRVWDEILRLPLKQRTALLLNLREESGGAAITLLPSLRLATIRQIAAALEMPAEALAELWAVLPLDDAAIGEKLGASRQQVANLRKCARERLSRRLSRPGAA